jgi:hypothetical protein
MNFNFRFDVYLHNVPPPSDPVLATLVHQGKSIMTVLQKLIQEVAETKAVNESAVTLLQGLKVKLDEAIASGDPAVLQALVDELDASTNGLAAAVIANTPDAPVVDPVPAE